MTEWDNIKVRDLQRFAAVVEAGGFTLAAGALGESPKQLSRRIGQLEEQVGTRLFHRTTRSVRPTPEGSLWYADVRAVLDRLQDATEAIRPAQALVGRVRVQVPTLFVDAVLDWASEQLVAHEGLSLDLLVGDRSDDLLGRGIDVCLSGVPPEGATVLVRQVGTARPVLAAHPAYLERRGAPERPEDLAQHECLRFVGPDPQTRWPLTHEDGRRIEVPVAGRLACNDSRTLLNALLQGMGIGPLTAAVVRGRGDHALEVVLPGWSLGGISLYLALAPGRHRLWPVRYVADELAAVAGRMVQAFPGPSG